MTWSSLETVKDVHETKLKSIIARWPFWVKYCIACLYYFSQKKHIDDITLLTTGYIFFEVFESENENNENSMIFFNNKVEKKCSLTSSVNI